MRLEIRSQQLDVPPAFRDAIERKLWFALGRFGSRIDSVTVHLADVNRPRGGTDKRCRIVVHLRRTGEIVVEDCERDLEIVVDRTLDRIGQAVRRSLDRWREQGGQPGIRRGHLS